MCPEVAADPAKTAEHREPGGCITTSLLPATEINAEASNVPRVALTMALPAAAASKTPLASMAPSPELTAQIKFEPGVMSLSNWSRATARNGIAVPAAVVAEAGNTARAERV